MLLAVICILLFVLMLCGLPVAYAFLGGSLAFLIITGGNLGALASTAFASMNSFAYLAMPLFILAGALMSKSGIAESLCNFCMSILRRFKGGMGHAIILASMLFGMLTGSNTATIMAVNAFMTEPMKKRGWSKEYIAAIMAASGPLGYMIPPNANAIMFAVIAQCSVSALFMASVIPGIIWGIMMMVVNRCIYKKHYNPANASEEYVEEAKNEGHLRAGETNGDYFAGIGRAFVSSIPALLMPVIIFGGIYGGIFTATEAGAVSGLYAIILGFFIKRKMNARQLWSTFTDTGYQMGIILFITPMAAIFTRVLVVENVPQLIATTMMAISSSRVVLLLIMDLVFIIAGFFVGPTVIIYVVTPVLLPSATMLGVSPIQLGCMLFVAIGIGNITPPMAMNLFIASKAVGVETTKVIPPMMYYFIFTGIPMMLLVTFVPALSEWLPALVG